MQLKNLFTFLFIACSFVLYAQKPDDYAQLKAQYPKHNYVFLQDDKHVTISVEDDSVQMVQHENERIYFMTDRANAYKNRSVTTSYFVHADNIEARTFYRKGNRYKKEKVKDFETKKTISTDYFYDDLEKTSFEFPKLRNEGITELKTTKRYKTPYFSVSAFFGNFSPVMHKTFKLEVDRDVEVGISYFNVEPDDLNYTVEEKRKKIIHTWRLDSIDAVEREPGSPSPSHYLPHVSVRVKSYTKKDGDTVNILRNPSDLFAWYETLISDVSCESTDELEEALEQVILPEDDEITKVEKVFNLVREKIKYIAIEDGLGGFIPRNPDLVYTRRYGDCKDMSALIVQMLDLADVKAHKTWIGTKDIPYTYEEMPTPSVDNHMIAAWKNPETNEYVFLDATDNFVPFGFPTYSIQGKEAMIHLGEGKYTIEEVPVIAHEKNYWRDTSYLKIDNDKLTGTGSLTLTGYFANTYNHLLNNAHDDKRLKNHVKNNTLKGNNKYSLKEFDISKSDSVIKYTFDFEIGDYTHQINDEVYINMNLEKSFETFTTDFEDRELDLTAKYHKAYGLHFVLEISDGYAVDNTPENSDFEHPLFGYSITYSKNDNNIAYNLNLEQRYLSMQPEHFDDYKKMLKSLKKEMKKSVTLKKVTP